MRVRRQATTRNHPLELDEWLHVLSEVHERGARPERARRDVGRGLIPRDLGDDKTYRVTHC